MNNLELIKNKLENTGYCIVLNILNTEELNEYKNEFMKWYNSIPNLEVLHNKIDPHGIFKYHQVGHQRHAWLIRCNKKIQNIFKYLWNTDELVVSFDGCCYIDKECKKVDNIWTHTDQSKQKTGLHCYQGYVALTSNKERTLVVYEESHKLHEDYFNVMNIDINKDWNLIDYNYLKKIQNKKRILEVPAGALVLWDSRTFHQNQYGKPNSEERLVQYVSYLPKNNKKNTNAIKNKRQKYFETFRTTSHWAYPIKVNSLQPRNYGDTKLNIEYDKLIVPDLDDLKDEIKKII